MCNDPNSIPYHEPTKPLSLTQLCCTQYSTLLYTVNQLHKSHISQSLIFTLDNIASAYLGPQRKRTTSSVKNNKICSRRLHEPVTYFFPPFFLAATTLKFPFAGSSLGVSGFAGPFFATSLQPPGAALAGLPLLGGVEVSTRPLSASLLRRMNSSAKWRESMVELLP